MIEHPKRAKLPKWAQGEIQRLERERDNAIRQLNEFCDNQTPSPVFVRELCSTGENQGPTDKVHYVQTHRLTIEWYGIRLEIYLSPERDAHRSPGIELQWEDIKRHGTQVAMIPKSYQLVELVSKDNLR